MSSSKRSFLQHSGHLPKASPSHQVTHKSLGAVHFFAKGEKDGRIEAKEQERGRRDESQEQTGTESSDASRVSAGLRDALGMTPWRKEHPKAPFREIEEAVDERVNQLRAQLIQDVVHLGETEAWDQRRDAERPKCATWGQALSGRGEQTRWIQTTGGEAIKLTRTYGTCPECGAGFFPHRTRE